MIKAETQLWKEPPDEIILAVATVVNHDNTEWIGSASELITLLGLDLQPNAFTRRLNINADNLLNQYNIRYENSRTLAGRQIKLTLIETEA